MGSAGFAGTPFLFYNLLQPEPYEIFTKFFTPNFKIIHMEK